MTCQEGLEDKQEHDEHDEQNWRDRQDKRRESLIPSKRKDHDFEQEHRSRPHHSLVVKTDTQDAVAAHDTGSLTPQSSRHVGDGTKAYLAHTAAHLFPHASSSDDLTGPSGLSIAGTPSSRSPSPSLSKNSPPIHPTSSKHKVPPHFRGPLPRDTDAEEVAPLPPLHAVPGSSTLFQPFNTPLNRNGWRYTFAGPDTTHMPNSVYRSIPAEPAQVRWDWSDRSGFTKMSQHADVMTSDKGWRSARGNIPVRQGSWYCEIEVLPPEDSTQNIDAALAHQASATKDGPHVRLGWARREAPLNAPVGFDAYSYGLRDTTGQRVFLSRPLPYGEAFKAGDVIGLYIHVPPLSKPSSKDMRDPRHVRRRRIPIKYRGQAYFEQLEYVQTKEMEHLMERSWAGEQLLRTDGSLALHSCPDGLEPDSIADMDDRGRTANGKRVHKEQAPSQPTAPPGTGKSKRQAGPGGSKDSKSKRPQKTLRPLPTLGEESRIGFFLNGRPQGWAFRDLLDFRPLRGSDPSGKKKKLAGPGGGGGGVGNLDVESSELAAAARASADEMAAAGLGLDDTPLLTTSASLAAIMKSRENAFDDGSLGYFPYVSLYGGARAKIRAAAAEMKYPLPWDQVEALLEGADHTRQGRTTTTESSGPSSTPWWWGQTRPLSERYAEYWSEQWQFDVEEEERARIRAKYWKPPQDDDDDEEDGAGGGGGGGTPAATQTKVSSSKRKTKRSNQQQQHHSQQQHQQQHLMTVTTGEERSFATPMEGQSAYATPTPTPPPPPPPTTTARKLTEAGEGGEGIDAQMHDEHSDADGGRDTYEDTRPASSPVTGSVSLANLADIAMAVEQDDKARAEADNGGDGMQVD